MRMPPQTSPILIAVEANDKTTIDHLINHSTDINDAGTTVREFYSNHWTPLECAINFYQDDQSEERLDLIKFLVERGANVTSFTNHNEKHTPLTICAEANLPQLAQYLIDMGATIFNESGHSTALIVAISQKNLDMIEILLDNGAKFDSQSTLDGISTADLKIIEIFKKKKLLDKLHEDKICAVLMTAIETGDLDVIEETLKNVSTIDVEDRRTGKTPLILSIDMRNYILLKKLIENGADINFCGNGGNSNNQPLIKAIESNNFLITKCLIEHGAIINSNLALRAAAKQLNFRIFNFLIKKGADATVVTPELDNFAANESEVFSSFWEDKKIKMKQ